VRFDFCLFEANKKTDRKCDKSKSAAT